MRLQFMRLVVARSGPWRSAVVRCRTTVYRKTHKGGQQPRCVSSHNKDINYEINELNIPGYTMYHNIQYKGERGVATYVSTDLESIFLKSASGGLSLFLLN